MSRFPPGAFVMRRSIDHRRGIPCHHRINARERERKCTPEFSAGLRGNDNAENRKNNTSRWVVSVSKIKIYLIRSTRTIRKKTRVARRKNGRPRHCENFPYVYIARHSNIKLQYIKMTKNHERITKKNQFRIYAEEDCN